MCACVCAIIVIDNGHIQGMCVCVCERECVFVCVCVLVCAHLCPYGAYNCM